MVGARSEDNDSKNARAASASPPMRSPPSDGPRWRDRRTNAWEACFWASDKASRDGMEVPPPAINSENWQHANIGQRRRCRGNAAGRDMR